MLPGYPRIAADDIGWLTEDQMIEVDRVMIDELGIDLTRMMENAGRNLAQLALDRFAPSSVQVLAGRGGNGGGGLVAARHLANRGVNVHVTLSTDAGRYVGLPGEQLAILQHMGGAISDEPAASDLLIDALIGYSLRGAPRGRAAELIAAIPKLAPKVLSLDTPSGLDVTAGTRPGAAVSATATLTLALPKEGLRGSPNVGELFVADISVPPSVYTTMGLVETSPFASSPIVAIEKPT